MLTDKLRDGAHGKVFKILFWIIILSFVFAGVGNYLIPHLNTDPVEVGKYKIKAEEWNSQYQNRVRMLQSQYGSQISTILEDPKAVKTIRMQVLEGMIDNVALNSVTYDQGIRVGDEQVKAEIRKDKTFHTDGKFDNNKFLAIVRNMGSSPDYYAHSLRSQLATQTMFTPVISVKTIAYPYEIDVLSKLISQERVVDLYTVNQKLLSDDIKIDDNEVKKYYDEHHDFFMKPSSVQFNYIVVSKNDLKKYIKPTQEELENFYSLNQSDFEVEEQREASQILIKASTEDFAKKAQDALTQLKSGTSFEDVGSKFSDSSDFEKDHGSLGLLEKGSLSKELDVALFALKSEGDYSTVIIDEAGAHIIRLDKIQQAYTPELAKIKDAVEAKYIDAKAQDLFTDISTTLTDKSYESPDSLDVASEEVKKQITASDYKLAQVLDSKIGDNVGNILKSGLVPLGAKDLKWPLSTNEVQKVAFNEEQRTSNMNSNIIPLGDDACAVVNVTEYNESTLEKFENVSAKALKLAKDAIIKQESDKILASIQGELLNDSTPQASDKYTVVKDVVIARDNREYSPEFVSSVFAIADKKNTSVVATNKDAQTLAVLKEVRVKKMDDVDQYDAILRTQLMQIKQQLSDNVIRLSAREESKIKYNEDAINAINQQNSSQE